MKRTHIVFAYNFVLNLKNRAMYCMFHVDGIEISIWKECIASITDS